MYSKDVFGVLPASIRAVCYTIDAPHVNKVGAPSAPKDDAVACITSFLDHVDHFPLLTRALTGWGGVGWGDDHPSTFLPIAKNENERRYRHKTLYNHSFINFTP